MKRNSSVSTAMGYKLDGRGSILAKGKPYISILQRPYRFWGPTWVPGALFPRVKWPGREVRRPPPSISNFKNGSDIRLFPPYAFMVSK
jgi:hypothetical protein